MSPWGYIWSGLGVSVLAGILIGIGLADGGERGMLAVLGFLVGAVASALIGIGVVAQGVRMGMRYHQFDYDDAERAVERLRGDDA